MVWRELLAQYGAAWERHGIRFGVECSPGQASSYRDVCPAFCFDGVGRSGAVARGAAAYVVRDDTLTYRFPHGHPKVAKRGMLNRRFLDSQTLARAVARLVNKNPVPPLIVLPVPPIYRTEVLTAEAFAALLDRCLGGLPPAGRYAVEIRNGNFLLPAYFDALERHGAAPVLTAGEGMPLLTDQAVMPRAVGATGAVVRVRVPLQADTVLGIVTMVRRCVTERKTLSVFLCGSTPHLVLRTLQGLMDMLNNDLAALSVWKNRAA